ncbi:MAG: hypothetical protein II916_06220 [Oscillospiraceae bacterium]|nr:hypothetical protein [Oscillospiraceae bacterium]
MKRIMPLCMTAAIAVGATSVIDRAVLDGGLPTSAGLFGDVNNDGNVNASDAAEILMYAAWKGSGHDGDLVYFESLNGVEIPTEEATTEAPTTEVPTETEPATEETTEAPSEPAEDASELYAALSAEWAKTGDSSMQSLYQCSAGSGNAVLYDGKVYFYTESRDSDTDEWKTTIWSYDIETKELSQHPIQADLNENMCVNGSIYVLSGSQKLVKYDMDGNELAALDIWEAGAQYDEFPSINGSKYTISDTGYVYITGLKYQGGYGTYYLTSDFKLTAMPDPVVKDSHGLETSVDYLELLVAYGSKCYATGRNHVDNTIQYLLCFDAATGTWTELPTDNPMINLTSDSTNTKTVGKYCIFYGYDGEAHTYVYDMEKDELLPYELPNGFDTSYYGGSRNLDSDSNDGWKFRSRQLVKNGDAYSWSDPVYLTEYPTSGTTFLDDTYYLLIDNAGIFLRTYEKGAEGEELVYRFES